MGAIYAYYRRHGAKGSNGAVLFPMMTDEELMVRTAGRDRDAFESLVRRHQSGLLNFFRRMGDYNDAEDLAQETFVRLFKYRKRYRPKAKFTTFLYMLARRTWIDHLRKRERKRTVQESFAEEARHAAEMEDSPSDAMKTRVDEALRTLSDEMRQVVVMSVYQGFKYREIADVLDVPLGTVKTRMYHALRKLKDAIGTDDSP